MEGGDYVWDEGLEQWVVPGSDPTESDGMWAWDSVREVWDWKQKDAGSSTSSTPVVCCAAPPEETTTPRTVQPPLHHQPSSLASQSDAFVSCTSSTSSLATKTPSLAASAASIGLFQSTRAEHIEKEEEEEIDLSTFPSPLSERMASLKGFTSAECTGRKSVRGLDFGAQRFSSSMSPLSGEFAEFAERGEGEKEEAGGEAEKGSVGEEARPPLAQQAIKVSHRIPRTPVENGLSGNVTPDVSGLVRAWERKSSVDIEKGRQRRGNNTSIRVSKKPQKHPPVVDKRSEQRDEKSHTAKYWGTTRGEPWKQQGKGREGVENDSVYTTPPAATSRSERQERQGSADRLMSHSQSANHAPPSWQNNQRKQHNSQLDASLQRQNSIERHNTSRSDNQSGEHGLASRSEQRQREGTDREVLDAVAQLRNEVRHHQQHAAKMEAKVDALQRLLSQQHSPSVSTPPHHPPLAPRTPTSSSPRIPHNTPPSPSYNLPHCVPATSLASADSDCEPDYWEGTQISANSIDRRGRGRGGVEVEVKEKSGEAEKGKEAGRVAVEGGVRGFEKSPKRVGGRRRSPARAHEEAKELIYCLPVKEEGSKNFYIGANYSPWSSQKFRSSQSHKHHGGIY